MNKKEIKQLVKYHKIGKTFAHLSSCHYFENKDGSIYYQGKIVPKEWRKYNIDRATISISYKDTTANIGFKEKVPTLIASPLHGYLNGRVTHEELDMLVLVKIRSS